MNQLNSLIIEGPLVRIPEIKETANHSKLATFSMAVNRYYKKSDGTFEQEVSYFDVNAWGTLAETVEKKATKGICCRVVGRLKQDRWKDTEGRTQSKVLIVAEHVEFMKNSSELEKGDNSENDKQTSTGNSQSSKTSKYNKSELFGTQKTEDAEVALAKAAGFDIF